MAAQAVAKASTPPGHSLWTRVRTHLSDPGTPGSLPPNRRPGDVGSARPSTAAWSWTSKHGAIGPGNRLAARFGTFGSGSCLAFPPGAIFGERWISLGRDTLIGPHVSISAGMVPGQKMVTDPVVRIGDRCMIGRGSHIVGHFQVEVGDDVHTGPYVYITDQNHGYLDPDQVVHAQWPNDVPVLIGSGSWLGTGVVILPGTGPREERRGRGRSGRARHLSRPLRHRRCAGPGGPALRARLGLDGRQRLGDIGGRDNRRVACRSGGVGRLLDSGRAGRVGAVRGGRNGNSFGSARHGPRSGRLGEDAGNAEPVAAHHLGRLLAALGDEGLGRREVIEVTGTAFGPTAHDDVDARGQLAPCRGRTSSGWRSRGH